LFAGSFFNGAALMACFAAGAVPLYALAQSQFARLQTRLSPLAIQRSRMGLAWIAAILLAWRVSTGAGAGLAGIHCQFCL
jgi:hypothetical protein